jgi:hypothetical protein
MTFGLAIIASIGLAVQAVPGTVEGVVRSSSDGSPLSGAEVSLLGTERTVIADGNGRYSISQVPSGEARLRATRLGFGALDVELSVPSAGRVIVDFHLQIQALVMPPVTVVEHQPQPEPEPPPAAAAEFVPAHATVRILNTAPGVTELGIASGARALMGPDPPAPDNVLYVRGAGAALDLVLLDGAPVHAPFHLGGLVEPGLPPSIQLAERMQGGLTSRYDGGLSDVLLLSSRPGNSGVHSMLFADMLAAGGSFEAADSDLGAVYVSLRSLHNSWNGASLNSGLPQRYSDALLRTDLFVADSDLLSLTLFRNEETVRLEDEQPFDEPRWGNTAGSLRYQTKTEAGLLELGAAVGEFSTRLPVGASDPLTASGLTRRVRVWADFSNRVGETTLGYGLQGDRLSLKTQFREAGDDSQSIAIRQRAAAGAIGAWFEAHRPITNVLDLKAGLRANFLTDGMGNSLSPRLLLGWQLAPDFRLTGSFGRFHQMVVTVDTELPSGVVGSIFSEVGAARSTHLILGAVHSPSPRELVRVEAFWKSSSGVPEFGEGALRNVGIDVLVGRPLAPLISIWGAYSVGWAWADFATEARQSVYSARHFLRGGITLENPGNIRLDADVSLGQGLEFGAIPRSERAALSEGEAPDVGQPPPTGSPGPGPAPQSITIPGVDGPIFTRAPDGSYLRLNFQVTGDFDIRFLGRDQKLLPYFRLVNALGREDALFFRFDADENIEPTPIGSVPLLPVIGLEWRM